MILAVFRAFDRFVHVRVMNPMFELVQRWFHWNRFQLITRSLQLQWIAYLLAGIGYFLLISFTTGINVPTSLISGFLLWTGISNMFVARHLMPDLHKMSATFEEGGSPKPTTQVLLRRARAQRLRPMLTAGTAHLVGYSAGLVAVQALTLTVLCLVFGFAMEMTEAHLWDSKDVDPHSRRSVLEPDGEVQSAH